MKQLNLRFVFAMMLVVFSSCHHERYPITTISMNTDDLSLTIKCCGKVSFTDDSTAIKSLSPDGFLRYRKNKDRLVAESDNEGKIYLALYNDGKKLALDAEGKKFLADAVKEMIYRQIDKKGSEEQYY